MPEPDLRGRHGPWAVVAGASTGLGAAFANEVANCGPNVVPMARRPELLEETARSIRERHGAGKAYELILAEGLWDELRDRGVDVLGYVVGATNTPHYQEVAARGSTPMAEEIKELQEGLSDSVAAPHSPEAVAAALFPLLDQGPRQYSHPDDEAAAKRDATRSRREVGREMGEMSSFVWG